MHVSKHSMWWFFLCMRGLWGGKAYIIVRNSMIHWSWHDHDVRVQTIPSRYAADHLQERTQDIILCRPSRKDEWSVRYYYNTYNRGFQGLRFFRFVHENKLREGDSCVGMKAGTGKSRTDRHRIPIFPIECRIFGKKRNQEKIRENSAKSGSKSVGDFSWPNSRIPFLIRFFPYVFPN